jgi:hypothetical protein
VKRGIVRLAVLLLVIGSGAAIVTPLAFAESHARAKAPLADPTRLWSAFPLHPNESPLRAKPVASARTTRAPAPDLFGAPHSSRLLLFLLLGVPMGLSVLLLAMAGAPAWALPEPLVNFLYNRRGGLAFAGVAIAVGVGLGTAVSLIGS